MNMDFVLDKTVVLASLERSIAINGLLVTNMDFACHLFLCARDMLPFEDALLLYGYTEEDFEAPVLGAFRRCYNIGNSHIKRELTNRLVNEPKDRAATLDLLDRLFGLYLKSEESGGNISVNFNLQPSQGMIDDQYSVTLHDNKERDNT